jgi:hypothetical protein
VNSKISKWCRDSNITWIIVESRIYVQSMIEAEGNYQGITLDERMALCHMFDNKEEDLVIKEQFSDAPLLGGYTK